MKPNNSCTEGAKIDRIVGKSGDPMSEQQAERLYDYAMDMEIMLRVAMEQLSLQNSNKSQYIASQIRDLLK